MRSALFPPVLVHLHEPVNSAILVSPGIHLHEPVNSAILVSPGIHLHEPVNSAILVSTIQYKVYDTCGELEAAPKIHNTN